MLDLCAAPGGKSTQLASYLGETGLLVSNEINGPRSKVLSGNLERWGSRNILVTNNDPDTLAAAWPQTFDRILVDAPCSGEGMFRKDPDAIQYWHRDYPAECAARQEVILQAAIKMLRPGGSLIYSTCTFSPEEDEQIIAWLLAHYDLTLEPIKSLQEWLPVDRNGQMAILNWQKQCGCFHISYAVKAISLPNCDLRVNCRTNQ